MRSGNLWIATLGLVAAFAGCIKPQQQPAPAAAAAPEAPQVLVEVPQTGDITDYEDFTGRTVATKTIDIRARVTGYLTKINFSEKEGQDVEQNSVLFEIDPRPYEAEMARTEAAFLQAQSHLKRIDLDYQRAAKTVDKKVI